MPGILSPEEMNLWKKVLSELASESDPLGAKEQLNEKVMPGTPQNRMRLKLAELLLKASRRVSGLY